MSTVLAHPGPLLLRAAVAEFRSTGLERSERLARDIAFFKEEYGLEPSPIKDDGPGVAYSTFVHSHLLFSFWEGYYILTVQC